MLGFRFAAANLFYILLFTAATFTCSNESGIEIHIVNASGGKIDAYWINPNTSNTEIVGTYADDPLKKHRMNSFVGHVFEIREVPDEKGSGCGNGGGVCRVGRFEVGPEEGQFALVTSSFRIDVTDAPGLAFRQSRRYDDSSGVDADSRTLSVQNDASVTVEVLWVDRESRKREVVEVLRETRSKEKFPVKTYVGNLFEVREVPDRGTGLCKYEGGKRCRTAQFTVNDETAQVVHASELLHTVAAKS